MSRNTDILRHMIKSEEAPVDFNDPHSVRRAQHKSFCQYVTNCVLSYDESEFEQFQSSFIVQYERFKAERRDRERAFQHRLTGTIQSIQPMQPRPVQPTISQPINTPVPLHLGFDSSHQYQPDPAPWLQNAAPSTSWAGHSTEYNTQLHLLQQQHQQHVQDLQR